MKKRILSLLLVLILLVTVSVFAVEAADEEPIAFDEANADENGDLKAYCEACGGNVTWNVASVDGNGVLQIGSHSYVPSTSTGDAVWTTLKYEVVGARRCLYLNGDVVHSSSATQAMFRLYTANTTATNCILNIMGTGTITNNSAYQVAESSTNSSATDGGVNKLIVRGGTIDCTNCTATSPVFYADATRAPYSTFDMRDGVVKGAKLSKMGGALRIYAGGTFTMSGGEIIGNACTSSGAGTIYMNGTSSARTTFTMTGGTIRDGSITSTSGNVTGGNIYFEYCDAEISGEAKIQNGSVTTTGSSKTARGGNIFATSSSTLLISGNAEISGGWAKAASSYAYGGNILTQSTVPLTISGGIIKNGYTSVGGNLDTHGGNLYTFGSVTMTDGTIQDGYTVRYDTNSYTSAKNRGGNVYVGGSTFSMSGGTIQVDTWDGRQAGRGGNVCVAGTFNVSGSATIQNGNATRGANIYVASGKTLNVSGGTIQYGSGTYGGNVFTGGTLTLSGGTIADGVASNSDNTAYGPDVVVSNDSTDGVGKLTVANGFTGTVKAYFVGTDVLSGNVISSTLGAASSYTNAGNVLATISDVEYPVVGSGDNLVLAEAASFNGNEIVKYYATVEDASTAIGAVGDGYQTQYVQLLLPATFELTQKTIVDFNGQDAEVTGGAYLIGMDSKTDTYVDNGAAEVTINDGYHLDNIANLTISGKGNGTRKYLALDNGDDTYSFHRYYLTIDGAGLRYNANGPGLLYSAAFKGDAVVAEAINNSGEGYGYGIDYFIGEDFFTGVDFIGNGVTFATDGQLQTGKKVAFSGFMTEEGAEDDGAGTYLADIQITGKAYIEINGEKVYCSNPDTNSLQDVVRVYYSSNDAAIVDMKEKYGTVFSEILKWDFAV